MGVLPDSFLAIITDDGLPRDEIARIVARACSSGRPLIQLRMRRSTGAQLLGLAEQLRRVTSDRGCALVIHDRIDVALAVGADGVHLPGSAVKSLQARALLGDEALLGRSVHTLEEVEHERRLMACDYLQFGPVWATPSKAAYGPPQGLDRLASAVRAAEPIAVAAVGGVTASNVELTLSTGVRGVAVIGAVMHAAEPGQAVRRLSAAMAAAASPRIRRQ